MLGDAMNAKKDANKLSRKKWTLIKYAYSNYMWF